jgi:two-component system phosphate regulon sensor histidine kinase PhoR
VIDDNGTQIVIALTDISEQHHNEQMRKDFVANVSHELRSPLTALAGFIETLQGPAKHDQMARERFLLSMERETSRMSRLVSDLLSLSRLEADQNIMPKEKCDIVRIAQRVTGLLDQLAKSETKRLKLKLEDVELFVSGNSDALTQLFRNLIENAIKYSADHSEVEVDVSCKKDIAGMTGPTVAITIKDRGYGIPKEHIARLTERFYRVDTDRSRDKGGTGLGLAIVKHIVNQHRGRLKIQSEIGVGSTFTVYLPLLS